MKDISKYVPVDFEKLEEFKAKDTRFMKVKIWLMHLGENLNGSYFSKDAVQRALPTLANTPILAYLEPNSSGEDDFADHRTRLRRSEDGEIEWEYMGQAIGVIPETNMAQFETKVGEDGVQREYLTCEGLIWTKWDKPIEIFDRDNVKSQSMELHEDFEGHWNEEDGLFHFEKFKFFGACALGFDVLPAMVGATIEPQFSFADFKMEMQKKMEEYKSYCKGGQKMEEKLALLEEYSISKEQLEEQEINFEEIEVEDLKAKLEEMTSNTDDTSSDTDADDNTFDDNTSTDDGTTDDETADDGSDDSDDEGATDDEGDTDNEFVAKEVYDQLKSDYDNLQTAYSNLEKENKNLSEFKENKLAEERKVAEAELFSNFDEQLEGVEEYDELKSKSIEYSLDDLEVRCYAVLGKHVAKFSSKRSNKDKNVKFNFDANDDSKPKSNKPYYTIIEKHNK